MHLSEGEIHQFHDGEMPTDRRQRTAAHLEACARCRKSSQAITSRMQFAGERLANPKLITQPAQAARLQLQRRLAEMEKETQPMFKKIFTRLPRGAWVTLGVIAVLAVALSFPSVRVIANSFLGLFRVERVQVIPVDLQSFPDRFGSADSFEKFMSNQLVTEGFGEAQAAASAAEASQSAGMPVRLPGSLDGTPKLGVQPGGKMTFQVDYALARAVLDEIGRSDILLPEDIDGAAIVLEMKPAVMAMYGDCLTKEDIQSAQVEDPDQRPQKSPSDCTTLLQMPSPTISAPPGLNLSQLGEAYLQILGLSPEEAASFAGNVDWTTTFVIPIPQRAEYQDVAVDGVTGTLVESYERGASVYVLLWVKDGRLYALSGPGEGLEALEIANSLK